MNAKHTPEIQARIDAMMQSYYTAFATAWLRSHQVTFDLHCPPLSSN